MPGKADKAYMQDAGLRAYLTASAKIEDLEQTGAVGNVVEGILFDHVRRLQFNTLNHRNGRIGYWDKPEIDFLVELPKVWLAIECKYRTSTKGAHSRVAKLAAADARVVPIVITRNEFELGAEAIQGRRSWAYAPQYSPPCEWGSVGIRYAGSVHT